MMKIIGLALIVVGVIGWATSGSKPPHHYVLESTLAVIAGFIVLMYGTFRED